MEKQSKESAEKEAELKKELDKNKDSELKIRKLIEGHANEIKKLSEDKRDKKTKQASAQAELHKLENENGFLQKSIDWETEKLGKFLELKKTYV